MAQHYYLSGAFFLLLKRKFPFSRLHKKDLKYTHDAATKTFLCSAIQIRECDWLLKLRTLRVSSVVVSSQSRSIFGAYFKHLITKEL